MCHYNAICIIQAVLCPTFTRLYYLKPYLFNIYNEKIFTLRVARSSNTLC
jgi:hypothetical protein